MDQNNVVITLNELIETCKDGEEGFLACAQKVTNPALRGFFEDRALRCATGAVQLRAKLRDLGGDSERGGSTGTLHRGWTHFKSSLVGMDDDSVLAECETGEDAAKAAYEKALRQDLPPDVRQLIETQYREVKTNHDSVHDMRNAAQ